MLTDIGEYFVGAYLQLIEHCDFVDYNVRPPGGGLKGLGELDVVGLNFRTDTAFLCEVTTHIRGLRNGKDNRMIARLVDKHRRQLQYADEYLRNFEHVRYMFWSPVVPRGQLSELLLQIQGMEMIINGEYKRRLEQLKQLAHKCTHDARNPVFRMLQIMEHVRD